MKKVYMAPAVKINDVELDDLLQASITGVGGDSAIGIGTGETPTDADARPYTHHSVWDDEEF